MVNFSLLRLKFLVFISLYLLSSSVAFADFYWRRADGTYLRLEPRFASGWHQVLFGLPQIHPSTIPSNVDWTWEATGPNHGHWIGRVSQSPAMPTSNGANKIDAEATRQVELARQSELARQAELARQVEVKRQLGLGRESQLESESRGVQEEAKLYTEFQARQSEQRRIRETKHAEDKAAIDARVAKKKAMSEMFCFPGDTPVNVKDDSSRGYHPAPISSIRVGDFVVSCNLSVHGGTCEFGQVLRVIENTVDHLIKLSYGGKELKTTENHPIYVVDRGAYVDARDVKVGERFLDISGETVVLENKQDQEGEEIVFNLEIQGNNNYYACDVLVHNCNSIAALGTVALEVATVGEGVAVAANPVGAAILGVAATVYVAQQVYDHLNPPRAVEGDTPADIVANVAQAEGVEPSAVVGGDSPTGGNASKRFTEEQQALVDMAKKDKKTGISEKDMETYKDLNKELGQKGFPKDQVRGKERHLNRPHGKEWHGHVGPVDHIPIKD